jgi:uncharacterized membrane protein
MIQARSGLCGPRPGQRQWRPDLVVQVPCAYGRLPLYSCPIVAEAVEIMGLAILILGLAVFIGAHVFVSMRGERAALIARIGLGPYKGLFSLVSLVGLVLIVVGFGQYRATGWIDVWDPPAWTRHVALPLVWLAFICVIAAYVQGNIKRVLKHPMLVGVKLWALAHLIANGDLGSIVLFGSILAWAVYDRITVKHRTDQGGLPQYDGGWKNDAVAFVVGSIIFFAFGYVFHPLWIGVPVFGRTTLGT